MFSSIKHSFKNKQFLSLAGNGCMAVMSIITYGILYRVLPEDEMGNWLFFQFVFVLLDAFRTGFLQTPLIKFYSGAFKNRQQTIAGSVWFLAVLVTVIFTLPILPALLFVDQIADTGLRLFFKWYGISLLVTLPFNVAFWILQAEERFDAILILRVINQGSFMLFLLAILAVGQVTIQIIVYGYLGSSLLTSIIAIGTGWSKLRALQFRNQQTTREIFQFGKFSVGSYICSNLLRSSDSIIIKFMIGPSALAVYTLAQRVGEVIEIMIRSFLGTAMPVMAAAFNQNENEKVLHTMKKYAGTLTLLLIPIIISMFVLADVFVLFLGGSKYVHTEAANVLRIFMCFAFFYPIDRFFGITLDIIHKPQLNFIKVVLTLIINIAGDVIALKLLGNIYGAAAAGFITLLFGVCFGYFTLKRYLPFNLSGILQLGFSESKLQLSKLVRKTSIV